MIHFNKNFGLFLGNLNTNDFHKHYAIQISVSVKATIKITQFGSNELIGDSFYVPSNIKHRLLSSDLQLTILINPLSPLGRRFYQVYGNNLINLETNLKESLIIILNRFNINEIDFDQLCCLVLDSLNNYKCSFSKVKHIEDDRISKVLDFLNDNFEKVYSLKEIAAICHLSPSRFLHLFKEQTGLNFRRFQLWNRIIKSLPYLLANSITDTSYTFGFTDSSHYNRTFKETFGFTPKILK